MDSLQSITINFLFDKNFDGLFNKKYRCSCDVSDLMPCGRPSNDCIAEKNTKLYEKPFEEL